MKIFVGNLSRDVTEDDLRRAFEPFGEVASVNVIKD
ncbi:MAG: RNA-binding protein, partial [Gammaproteobacteria bacterium]